MSMRSARALLRAPGLPLCTRPAATSKMLCVYPLGLGTRVAHLSNWRAPGSRPERAERPLTAPMPMGGLAAFRPPIGPNDDPEELSEAPITGRHWTVKELRNKSFDDLHKLWFVLYKEKNMLMSELLRYRQLQRQLPGGDRRAKVRRSMKAIRTVIGERQRVKQKILEERQAKAKDDGREWEGIKVEYDKLRNQAAVDSVDA